MLQVYACLTTQHDWRLVLAAAVLCVAGVATTLRLYSQAVRGAPRFREAKLALCGVIGGAAIWGTHFIAMLGYDLGVRTSYDPGLTALSLLMICGGLWLGFSARSRFDGPRGAVIAGVLIGAVVAAMHFIGMAGVRASGAFSWDVGLVATAVLSGMVLWSCAFEALGRGGPRRTAFAMGYAVLAICALHFISMGAATFVPDASAVSATSGLSETRLAIAAAMMAAVVVGAAGVLTLISYLSHSSALTHLREAIDAMPDALGFYDAQDRLLVWNARYAEVNSECAHLLEVGRPFEDILRAGLEQGYYLEAEGREDDWVTERLAARRQLSSSLEQQTIAGRWIRVQDRRTSDGGVVTVVNDITDLKEDARILAEARDAAETANRAKSEFLANMSHEIRTPLNGVVGVAQALASTQLDHRQKEMLALIQSSSKTLQHLLSDILDLARVESGRMEIRNEPFDLERAVREAAQLYAATAQEKGLQFFVEIDQDCGVWVDGDITRLKQILTNLVSNAVKFTNTGFVSLTATRCAGQDGVPVFRFTVEDTGEGFGAEAKSRLFERFEQADGTITRRFGGTGLGLAICRQLATMMDGDLDCESEVGGGSAFILTVPMALADAPTPALEVVANAAPMEPTQAPRVLLADDHPTNRKVVELILTNAGIELTSVENGAEAVQAWRDRAFDLVLMDMQMPVMDGLSATREIRLHETVGGDRRIPIIMLTANALPEHVEAARAAGADRHLAKPFNAQELLTLVCDLAAGETSALAA